MRVLAVRLEMSPDWMSSSSTVASVTSTTWPSTVTVRLESPTAGLALNLRYDLASLPHLYQWKMMGQGAYALGLEPANCAGIGGRAAARAQDDLPVLEPGEQRSYALTFGVEELRAT